jgi:hypothetical protein
MKDLQNSLGHFDLRITKNKDGSLVYRITDEYKFPPPNSQRERHGFQVPGLSDARAKQLQGALPTDEYKASGGFREKWELKKVHGEWTLFVPQPFLDDMGVNFRVSGEFTVRQNSRPKVQHKAALEAGNVKPPAEVRMR